jgi:hypothetical protein
MAQGGAVFNSGTMLLSNTLFVSNLVWGASGGGNMFTISGSYSPGGFHGPVTGGAIFTGSNSVAVNCTFLGNDARGGSRISGANNFTPARGGDAIGGAIANTGSFQAVNLTLAGNTAVGGLASGSGTNGGSYGSSLGSTAGVFQIVNTLVSGSTGTNFFGTFADLGHNLSSDATPVWTSGTSLNSTDPLLLPLTNNGGPTLTMALRAGSPALNTADCGSAPPADQRGYPRPNGPGCDIGAYEGPGTPQLQIISQSSSTNVLRWLAEAGQVYRLEITSDFTGWTPFATNTAGSNGWLDFPVPANPSPRFFRLVAQ